MTHADMDNKININISRGRGRPPGTKNKPKIEIDPDSVVAAEELAQFVSRIERLEEEKKALSEDIKEVFSEASGRGFDARILRQVIRIRKQDHSERMETEAILSLYLRALGMV